MLAIAIATTILKYTMLGVLLVVASMTDLRERRISNKLTYSVALFALSIALLNQTLGISEAGPALIEMLKGLTASFAVMFVAYVTIGIGAGDVKLAAAIGGLVGTYHGMETILWAHLIGGMFVVAALLWKLGPGWIVRKVVASCFPARVAQPVTDSQMLNYPVPMAVFFAAGSLLSLSGATIL